MSKNRASEDAAEPFDGTIPDPYRPGQRLKVCSKNITEGLPPDDYVRIIILEHFDKYPVSGPPRRPQIS